MRALRLKAERNGGVDRKGRGHRRHPPTHTASEGSLTSTPEAKNINQFCPPPALRKFNSRLINANGGQNQTKCEDALTVRVSAGRAPQFFFSPAFCLSQTFGHTRRFFSLCSARLKICFPEFILRCKKKKREGGKETREKAPLSWSLLAVRDKSFPFLTLPT